LTSGHHPFIEMLFNPIKARARFAPIHIRYKMNLTNAVCQMCISPV